MPDPNTTPLHVRVRVEGRESALQRLGFSSYNAYLASSAWRAVRSRFKEQRPWLCYACGDEDGLQLHHTTYERVGEEKLDDLKPLCAKCHAMVHELERRGDAGLDFEGVIDAARAEVGRAELAQQHATRSSEDALLAEQMKVLIAALPFDERLKRARQAAKRRHVDVSHDLHILDRAVGKQKLDKAWNWLDIVERKAFGSEHWGDLL